MTREEAINQLQDAKDGYKEYLSYEALDMAIEALEQEPITRNCFGCKYSKDNHNAGTEECHLCMWENQYTPTTKNDLGVDAISREDVLKLIYDYKENHSENREKYPINYGTLLDMIRWVRNLPSVTPQEPFINKPCISSGVCEHDKQKVLDKIREEIKVMTSNRGFLSCSVGYIHEEIDNVFDKYKAEIELQKSEE